MSVKLPKWVPAEVHDWFSRVKDARLSEPHLRFVTNLEMREVWEWFEAGRPHDGGMRKAMGKNEPETDDEMLGPVKFLICMQQAIQPLSKPSDMAPSQRGAYLEKVRKHASALIELLSDTHYDRHLYTCCAEPIAPEELSSRVFGHIKSMMEYSENERVPLMAAYSTDDEGCLYEMPHDFPNNSLVNTLHGIVEWSEQEDWYDGFTSVAAIRQTGIKAAKTHYLATFNKYMVRHWIDLPATHYATIANVALNLPEEEWFDEESARKQLARIVERIGKPEPFPPEFRYPA